jgi:hypothetical protein
MQFLLKRGYYNYHVGSFFAPKSSFRTKKLPMITLVPIVASLKIPKELFKKVFTILLLIRQISG